MTIQQQLHEKIDLMPEDTLQLILGIINRMQIPEDDYAKELRRKQRMEDFLKSAGQIDIDGDAILVSREQDMI